MRLSIQRSPLRLFRSAPRRGHLMPGVVFLEDGQEVAFGAAVEGTFGGNQLSIWHQPDGAPKPVRAKLLAES